MCIHNSANLHFLKIRIALMHSSFLFYQLRPNYPTKKSVKPRREMNFSQSLSLSLCCGGCCWISKWEHQSSSSPDKRVPNFRLLLNVFSCFSSHCDAWERAKFSAWKKRTITNPFCVPCEATIAIKVSILPFRRTTQSRCNKY